MEDQRRIQQETALGYELDTITLREIAAMRYVRHHDWLHHVVGTAVPTDRITAPKIEPGIKEEELNKRLEKLKAELAELKKGEPSNWATPELDEKAKLLNGEIVKLRDEFSPETAQRSLETVEKAIGKVIVPQEKLNPVPVTYVRPDDADADMMDTTEL